MRNNPVTIVMSLLAAFYVLVGMANLTELVGATTAAWLAIIGAMVQAAAGVWVRDQVTPLANPRDDLGRRLVVMGGRHASTE